MFSWMMDVVRGCRETVKRCARQFKEFLHLPYRLNGRGIYSAKFFQATSQLSLTGGRSTGGLRQ